jgi:hypothetical protein
MGAESTSGGRPGVDDGLAEAIPVALPERPEVKQQRTKGVVEASMDKRMVARELLALAKELTAGDGGVGLTGTSPARPKS